MLLAGAIFVLIIVLVIWQPKRFRHRLEATLGAVLALVTGVIHPGDIPAGVEYRLERDGCVYRRHYHQPAAG